MDWLVVGVVGEVDSEVVRLLGSELVGSITTLKGGRRKRHAEAAGQNKQARGFSTISSSVMTVSPSTRSSSSAVSSSG